MEKKLETVKNTHSGLIHLWITLDFRKFSVLFLLFHWHKIWGYRIALVTDISLGFVIQ